jgi:hypothetical protein
MKDCFWTVFNRREGVLKSSKSKKTARAWQRKHRPRGTRLVYLCIPSKD